MLRNKIKKNVDHDPNFDWRGRDVTRIENLSDIVFALALGMLVSSSTPPQTFSDLTGFLWNIIPVSAAFAMMLLIWNAHFVYFRRYGLSDGRIIFLNACLLLLVLFIAYPLRFVFDSLFAFVLLTLGMPERILAMEVDFTQSSKIVGIFAAGYAAIFLVFSQMYAHALKNQHLLGLSDTETQLTRLSVAKFYVQIAISFLVLGSALFSPLGAFSGFFYSLNWLGAILLGRWLGKPAKKIPPLITPDQTPPS